MISAGVEGRLPYMTYPEPWRGPPNKPPEFLRPAPKPLPTNNHRYNGATALPQNGTRLPVQRTPSKYSSPPAAPVNLVKEELSDDYSPYRFFPGPHPMTHFHPSHYHNLYQAPYASLLRPPSYAPPPPLSPIETYSPTTPTPVTGTFLSPPAAYSPPSSKIHNAVDRHSRLLPFKVPSGKEGSLKHRILTRPEDLAAARTPLDLQRLESSRKRSSSAHSPPQSPAKPLNNNNSLAGTFAKGSLIQLATGELKKVEDMRTEDFVLSAERSPELRLADSTVTKIVDNATTGIATITLSYNQRRTEVDVESPSEHPYFVYGQGWASCSPERTHLSFGLKVHRLQVGDILISLTPRETTTSAAPRSATIITTATTTAMSVRSVPSINHSVSSLHTNHPRGAGGLPHPQSASAGPPTTLQEDSAARKRRWSAPEQSCDEKDQVRRRVE